MLKIHTNKRFFKSLLVSSLVIMLSACSMGSSKTSSIQSNAPPENRQTTGQATVVNKQVIAEEKPDTLANKDNDTSETKKEEKENPKKDIPVSNNVVYAQEIEQNPKKTNKTKKAIKITSLTNDLTDKVEVKNKDLKDDSPVKPKKDRIIVKNADQLEQATKDGYTNIIVEGEILRDVILTYEGTDSLNIQMDKKYSNNLNKITINATRAKNIVLLDDAIGVDGVVLDNLEINAPNTHIDNSFAIDKVVIDKIAKNSFNTFDTVNKVEFNGTGKLQLSEELMRRDTFMMPDVFINTDDTVVLVGKYDEVVANNGVNIEFEKNTTSTTTVEKLVINNSTNKVDKLSGTAIIEQVITSDDMKIYKNVIINNLHLDYKNSKIPSIEIFNDSRVNMIIDDTKKISEYIYETRRRGYNNSHTPVTPIENPKPDVTTDNTLEIKENPDVTTDNTLQIEEVPDVTTDNTLKIEQIKKLKETLQEEIEKLNENKYTADEKLSILEGDKNLDTHTKGSVDEFDAKVKEIKQSIMDAENILSTSNEIMESESIEELNSYIDQIVHVKNQLSSKIPSIESIKDVLREKLDISSVIKYNTIWVYKQAIVDLDIKGSSNKNVSIQLVPSDKSLDTITADSVTSLQNGKNEVIFKNLVYYAKYDKIIVNYDGEKLQLDVLSQDNKPDAITIAQRKIELKDISIENTIYTLDDVEVKKWLKVTSKDKRQFYLPIENIKGSKEIEMYYLPPLVQFTSADKNNLNYTEILRHFMDDNRYVELAKSKNIDYSIAYNYNKEKERLYKNIDMLSPYDRYSIVDVGNKVEKNIGYNEEFFEKEISTLKLYDDKGIELTANKYNAYLPSYVKSLKTLKITFKDGEIRTYQLDNFSILKYITDSFSESDSEFVEFDLKHNGKNTGLKYVPEIFVVKIDSNS